jgi:Ca2+-binding EF-hand superfamily protein
MKKKIVIAVLAVVSACVAQAAIDPARAADMDKNKDGQITKEEYVAVFVSGFDRLDKDKDGLLSKTEFTHGSFEIGDKDKNGTLTRAEYLSIYEQQFDNKHDTNKDGVVTDDEIK